MRSKVYHYSEEGVKAMKHREALLHARKFSKWAPITLGHTISTSPLPNDPLIGGFTVTGVTPDGRLQGEYEFLKDRTPAVILDALRRGEKIRTSTGFDYLTGPRGQGYDYSQDNILLKHVAVFMPGDTHVKPRCTLGEGCGVGVDATGGDATRLLSYDAMVLGNTSMEYDPMTDPTPNPNSKPGEAAPVNPVGKPIESDKPPTPPAGSAVPPTPDPASTPPCPDKPPASTEDAALDALREICVDLDPTLKDVVVSIDQPEALRLLAKRAKDAYSAADASLPVGGGNPGNAKPHDLDALRKKQVEELRSRVKANYEASHAPGVH